MNFKEASSMHSYKLIDKFVLQNESTRHLGSQVSQALGEEHWKRTSSTPFALRYGSGW